jgi:hypothetical protein
MNAAAVSRRFGAAALVIGPLGLVASSLFQVVSDDDSVPASLAKIAAHPSGERAVIIFNLLATLTLPAVLYLMRLAGPRAPRLALAGGAVSFASWMAGLYAVGASDLLYYHAAESPDRASAVSLVHTLTSDGVFVLPELLFVVGHMVGLLLLGIALWRSGAVPRWAAALVGLAPIVQVPVHDSGVGSAVAYGLFLVGTAACAAALVRTPPEAAAPAWDGESDPATAGATAPLTR